MGASGHAPAFGQHTITKEAICTQHMKVHSGQITGHSQARGAIYRKPIITLQSFCSQQYRTTGVPFDKHSRDRSTNLKPYISQIVHRVTWLYNQIVTDTIWQNKI
jgi:hypothetical protein